MRIRVAPQGNVVIRVRAMTFCYEFSAGEYGEGPFSIGRLPAVIARFCKGIKHRLHPSKRESSRVCHG